MVFFFSNCGELVFCGMKIRDLFLFLLNNTNLADLITFFNAFSCSKNEISICQLLTLGFIFCYIDFMSTYVTMVLIIEFWNVLMTDKKECSLQY